MVGFAAGFADGSDPLEALPSNATEHLIIALGVAHQAVSLICSDIESDLPSVGMPMA